MKYLNYILMLGLVVMAGCKPKSAAPEAGAKTYAARGIVRQIADDRHTATIQHEAIPGYMSAMTMDFSVKNTNELNGIAAADEITFKLVVGETDSWIEGVQLVAHHIENAVTNAPAVQTLSAELKPGDPLPDCELVMEDGSPARFSDFRGRVVALTFFFSRCPLPDYCPRMNKNFSEARKLMLSTPDAPTNWLLLSISFDADFDNPQVLSSYARLYRGDDSNHWLFAAAPTNSLARLAPGLDLMIMRKDGNIMSHNLRTVVLDPQGRIYRQLDGKEWTPQQLAGAMLEAARPPAQP